MPTSTSLLRSALVALAFASPFVAWPVCAQDAQPLLVVVESANPYGHPGNIRAGIARELGTPAISLIEAQGARTIGTLEVAIAGGGRKASIRFVPTDGVQFAVLIHVSAEGRADRFGEWLVAPCVSAVRTSERRRASALAPSEILDPWLRARTTGGSAVLDPFVGDPPRRVHVVVSDYYLGSEVLDPWADVVADYQRDQARFLAVPRPGTATSTAPHARRAVGGER